ncbi:LuxR C-terminal-related transcriptional regulator [Sulfobacillus harzensis]|uniref:HTH luxR-type domain-containing protein n=1 Tax=Sulfobacillus harzensis TaxID=2729629 RepID=A0A7Y0L6B4_9FIRM|nr:LuxR C-terminal-related transcriptional regulator [Sulfobacillus harzensis]NMP24119.1 hypothetical protein [Sulfobacillus harzensis]
MAQPGLGPRLTKRERETLELVIQGMPLDRLSQTMHQSPKMVERYLHQGLQKLEHWSQQAAPGPTHNSAQDRDLGFLRPREAERAIARIVRAVGPNWACIVMLAISDGFKMRDVGTVADAMGRHIHSRLREGDVVTKWSPTEWVMFLPRITGTHIETVTQRLQHGHNAPWPVYVAALQPVGQESFAHVALQCHQHLLARYVSQDVAAYVNALAGVL